VGDSRLYHFRSGRVLTRTLDDTKTEQLHVAGMLTEEEMLSHPGKSKLLKCLGGNTDPLISLGRETRLYRNDALLLCSDGLWEAMPAGDLARYVHAKALELGVEEMLHDAEDRRRGAGDNLSAVCLRWEDAQTSTAPLQPHALTQADEKMLREAAKREAAEDAIRRQRTPAEPKRAKPVADNKTPRKTPAGGKPLEATLQEIEAFLQRFEKPKPE
jgi:serine/threonine protein phosphatase PrpC